MNKVLSEYFIPDEDAFCKDTSGIMRKYSIYGKYKHKRIDKAFEQADAKKHKIVSVCEVIDYVNEFLEMVKNDNNVLRNLQNSKNVMQEIKIGEVNYPITGNGVKITNQSWKLQEYDDNKGCYLGSPDEKYLEIQQAFNLKNIYDIVWLKFTKKGYLGVVARSSDINFSYKSTSGKLVRMIDDEWDESFVVIFPLTKEILNKHSADEIETAIGSYLIEKNVPIIDFYSHNY